MPEPKTRTRPEDSLNKMIASLKETTGKSLEEWKDFIAKEGWQTHSEIVKGLKGELQVPHAYANQIALRYLQSGEPSADPIAEMFAKRPEAKRLFDLLLPQINAMGPDVDTAPKKGYVSVRRAKQFAILQPAAGRLDLGLQLRGVDAKGRLEASGSFNSMLSHRIRLQREDEVDLELLSWLKQAYDAAK